MYQEYVKSLLEANPLVEETITEQRMVKGKPKGHKTRKVYTSGYWSRFSRKANHSNYWVYTKRVVGGRHRVVEVISYQRFIRVLNAYFLAARKMIIEGEALNMGSGIGIIQAMHIERNHRNAKINMHETCKQPMVTGIDGTRHRARIIYFTDDSYIRIGWVKFSKLTNERIYEFKPSAVNHSDRTPGFRDEFVKANMENPNLKLRYPYYPYIQKQQAS